MVGMVSNVFIPLGGDGHHHGAARLRLLQVRHQLVVHGALRGHRDDREALVDERDGAVLHLAGRIGLGVQVADLLELERALVADGGAHAAAHEQRARRVLARARRLIDGRGIGQDALHLLGRVGQLVEQQAHLVRLELALHLGKQHGEQRERHHLAQERLGGGHRDLLVGLRVDDAVALARHGRAHHVRDAEHLRALYARVADGGQRVGRLARLRHGHHQGGRRDDGVAVAEFAGHLHFRGDARPTLDEVLRDEARMIRRAAGDDVHAVDKVELLQREVQLVDGQRAVHQAPRQRVADHARLLVDLLQHEVGVAALLGHIEIPVDVRHLGLVRLAAHVVERDGIRRELRHIAVGEHHHVARVVDHGDDIGGHVRAVLGQPHHERRVLARGHEGAGLLVADSRNGIGADQAVGSLAHGLQEVVAFAQVLLHEVRDDLGVGLARERMAAAFQLFAQLGEVLDDAVMHDGYAAVAGGMRMRVRLAGAAMRGPARVADAAGAGQLEGLDELREAAHLPLAVHDFQLAVLLDGDAGRVIAAVFESRQTFDQDVLDGARSGVSDDSAHD